MEGYIWLVLTVVFALIEAAAPGLVAIWFAISSGILTLTYRYIESPLNQGYLFISLSFILLVVSRPISKKILSKRKNKIEDRIFGQVVVIKRRIDEDNYEVKLDGKYWKAISDSKLEVGDKAKVIKIEGIKLILEKE